jgi:peptidoglycan/xylan/chitin deacetylase (PgdA/CDA1 family)
MPLTIVMYHYVRDLARSRYPHIKGLDKADFAGQLDYIQEHYEVVGTRAVVAAIREGAALPENACLLTFDDGYLDHYETAYPMLAARGLTGSFYAPACLAESGKLLQVNKVHYVLAATEDHAGVKAALLDKLAAYRGDYDLPSDGALYAQFSTASRWDPPDTAFIKKVLQKGLPEEVAAAIAGELLAEFVGVGEAELATETYMTLAQMREMVAKGMEIGGHGYSHRPLGKLGRVEQAGEIERTLDFLEAVYGAVPAGWPLTYPSGSYNADTLELLGAVDCGVAMTTNPPGLAELDRPLEMRRVNTNDLPFKKGDQISEWTRLVIG